MFSHAIFENFETVATKHNMEEQAVGILARIFINPILLTSKVAQRHLVAVILGVCSTVPGSGCENCST